MDARHEFQVQPTSVSRSEAERLFATGYFEQAQAAFEALLQSDPAGVNWHLFQLGRVSARQERWGAAIEWFDRALAELSPVVWTRWERGVALQKLGTAIGPVAEEFAQLVENPPKDLSDGHYSHIAKIAHDAFDARHREIAGKLYDFLVAREKGGDLCRLRQADLRVDSGDPSEALRILDERSLAPTYAVWVDGVRARALLALGRNEEVAALLVPLALAGKATTSLTRMLFTALERSGDAQSLATPELYLSNIPEDQKVEFLLRAYLRREEYDKIATLFAAGDWSTFSAYEYLIAQAMNAANRAQDFEKTVALFGTLDAVAAGACSIISAMVSAHLIQKDWSAAGLLLNAAKTLLSRTRHQDLQLRTIEYLCFTLQFADAGAMVDAWMHDGTLPEHASATVAALYAALGRWGDVIELLADRVGNGFRINNPTFEEAILRAARRTERYVEVLELLGRAEDQNNGKSARIVGKLLNEISLAHALGLTPLRPDSLRWLDMVPTRRTSIMCEAVTARRNVQSTQRIFYCTDRNYLVGTCVSVFSLLRNNLVLHKSIRLSIVCTDDIAELASAVFGAIGDVFKVAISIVPATVLMRAGNTFQTGWGLFTPGHSLTEAAYYRIYMAQRLMQDEGGRALYVDSDTCIGPGIFELLDIDLKGMPLGARAELPLPEIRRAAVNLGIDPDRYFNSGVLLFDLDHPQQESSLLRAVDMAQNQQEMLTFLDQCALNVAFKDRVCLLPQHFNAFVRERTAPGDAGDQPVIWHYLDRPKPWDPVYDGAIGARWLEEFSIMATVLAPEQVAALMRPQFHLGRTMPATPADTHTTPILVRA